MEKLALTLPGNNPPTFSPLSPDSIIKDPTLGGVLSPLLDIIFLIASVLMFIWMLWGIFQYLFAGGDKERLGKARSRITWAIVGFCIVLLSFTIYKYVQEIFPARNINNVQTVKEPLAI